MTTKQFTNTLTAIAKIKKQLAPLETKRDELNEQLEQYKFDIMAHMQETKSKRTEPVGGYYVTRVAGRSVTRLTDDNKAKLWLNANGYDIESYMKLDDKRVIAAVGQELQETGEIIDFIETTTGAEYVSVKEAKA